MRPSRTCTTPRICTGILAAAALLLVPAACAAPEPPTPAPQAAAEAAAAHTVDHGPWAELLRRYVLSHESGIRRFDYGAVAEADRARLDRYVEDLQTVPASELDRSERLAFWINLYNALTVRVVLEHYPVDSILDIDLTPPGEGPWDAALARVEGRELSLNDLEHRILLPTFGDPRVHYAVNCASLGCPDLAPEPFTAADLDEQLDRAAREFVNHPRGARFEDGRLIVSSLYVWYRDDFGGSDEGVVGHLRQYAAGELAAKLAAHAGGFADGYDWRLNAP